jgi:hypothetical protein
LIHRSLLIIAPRALPDLASTSPLACAHPSVGKHDSQVFCPSLVHFACLAGLAGASVVPAAAALLE